MPHSFELEGCMSCLRRSILPSERARSDWCASTGQSMRITDDLRAQLDVIAQLNDRSVTEEIRLALEQWIERSKSDPKVLQRAETVRVEIESRGRDQAQRDLCHLRRHAIGQAERAPTQAGRRVVGHLVPVGFGVRATRSPLKSDLHPLLFRGEPSPAEPGWRQPPRKDR